MKKSSGLVYLIHFDQPYKHAKHYLGFSEGGIKARFKSHKNGSGARLLRVLNDHGIGYKIVRIWRHVDRKFERLLKKRGASTRLCPVCNPKK